MHSYSLREFLVVPVESIEEFLNECPIAHKKTLRINGFKATKKDYKSACNSVKRYVIVQNTMKLLLFLDREKLVRARYRKRWSQTKLAKHCKVSIATIWNAENGKSLDPTTAETICKQLGIDIDDVSTLTTRREKNGHAA